MAMKVYATQAKDIKLIEYATDIRMRAERRAGELLREMKERKERHDGDRPRGVHDRSADNLAVCTVDRGRAARVRGRAAGDGASARVVDRALLRLRSGRHQQQDDGEEMNMFTWFVLGKAITFSAPSLLRIFAERIFS
jgi:hypothetical protein